jgi:hypothetical protein
MGCTSCNKIKNKVISIGTGYKNILIPDKDIEPLAKERENICKNCEELKQFLKIGDKIIYKCNLCGCPIAAKIRSNDNCPKNKW